MNSEYIETPRTKSTVMVVEDDDGLRNLYRKILERGNYVVEDFSNPDSAYLRLQHTALAPKHFSIVLSDLAMPVGIQGLELAIKANEILPDLPFVIASGTSGDLNNLKLPPNLKKVLTKPLPMSELIRTLNEYKRD